MRITAVRMRVALVTCAACAVAVLVAPITRAGGPLLIGFDGKPVKWASTEVRGGPLNSQTVGLDANGVRQIFYHVDSGTLGTISESKARSLVDRIFKVYTDIPTADIDFINAGPIVDPATGSPVDVNSSNVGKFLSSKNPTFQNPIIFDSDGSITGGGGVLGFFQFLQVDGDTDELKEATVVLNGRPLTSGGIDETSFLGVFTHEFGHFAGPLDHAQINGNLAEFGVGAAEPAGFLPPQAFDVYAPFMETLYPFIFNAPAGSQFAPQFRSSGYFIATVDLDTQNALSNLYPSADYLSSRGSIEGRVLIRAGAIEIPISGINVVARRIDQAPYPPSLSIVAFPTPPTIDGDGVPAPPPAQASTDPLATVSSAVTGLDFGAGAYRIQGLPPGQYLVGIQQINPSALSGSGIGPLGTQIPLPFLEEYYNGPDNSSNSPAIFMPVTVTAGSLASGIDIILNGISNATPTLVDEQEPNEIVKKGQKLTFPVVLSGSASVNDDSKLKMKLPDGTTDPIEDLYRITVSDNTRTVFIKLEPTGGSGDLDLYLFSSDVSKKKTSLDDPSLISFSAGPTANEAIVSRLPPGTYVIGVTAFDGSLTYKLTILTTDN